MRRVPLVLALLAAVAGTARAEEVELAFRPLPFVARVETLEEARKLPEAELDIGLSALLVSKQEHPKLDLDASLRSLDDLARAVIAKTGKRAEPAAVIGAIGEVLETAGYRYFDGGPDGVDPRNAYLDQVLSERRGFCLTLSVLYLAIAERIGFELAMVEAPGHVFVRHGERPKHLNAETTDRGRLRTDAEYRRKFPFGDIAAAHYLQRCPRRAAVAALLMAHGLIKWRAQEVAAAEAAMKRSLAWWGERLVTLYNYAGIRLRLGKYPEALALYRRYTERRPEDPLGWYGQARAELRLGELVASEASLRTAAKRDPRSPELPIMRAEHAFARRQYTQALGHLRGAPGKSLEGAFLRSRVYFVQRKWGQAEAILRELLRKHPRVTTIHKQLVLCLESQKRQAACAPVLEKLLEVEPDDVDAARKLAGLKADAKDWAAAGALYARVLEADPDDRDLHRAAGDAFRQAQDVVKAREHYARFIALGGQDSEVAAWLNANR